MRLSSIMLALSLALTGLGNAANAASRWDADLAAVAPAKVRVDSVRLGEDLAAQASNIGQRDLDRLQEALRNAVIKELDRRGVLAAPGDRDAVALQLTLVSARPNRPTFDQLAGRGDWNWDRPNAGARPLSRNLSLASFGIGGVGIEGAAIGPDGSALGGVSYSFEENDIREAQYAATWTDAHRGIQNFASRLASALSD